MPDVVGRLRTPRLAAAPSSPAVGELYYDTASNKLFWWNGTVWAGTDMVYNGNYAGATNYKDGDIVVSGGVAYLCVRPTVATPTPWPTVSPYPDTTGKVNNILTVTTSGSPPTWQPPAVPGSLAGTYASRPAANTVSVGAVYYATDTLGVWRSDGSAWSMVAQGAPLLYYTNMSVAPWSTPYDGMEINLVLSDNVTVWHLKYYASSGSAYKWNFIGGALLRSAVDSSTSQESTTSTTWANLTTSGPSVTVPRAGEYDINFGSETQCSAGQYGQMAVKLGAAAVNDADPTNVLGASQSNLISVSRRFVRTLAAGDTVLCQYRTTGGTSWYRYRWLSVQPLRLS